MTSLEYREKLLAAADLCKRAGAHQFEVGYADEAGTDWWCSAHYRGARITVEHHAGPDQAAEALALRLLTGARCRCGKLVTLDGVGAYAFRRPVMADGRPFPLRQARKAGCCRWTREGERWYSACGAGRG